MGDNRIPKIDLILALSKSLDLVSASLSGHHMRVAYIALNIGLKLNLSPLDIKELIISALIHDAGALSFKDRIKTLDFDMKNPELHARIGYHLLKKYNKFGTVAEIVKYHHEDWIYIEDHRDKNRDIPISSYIIHLADRVDILIGQDRDVDINKIVEKILKERGRKFNPEVIDAFLDVAGKPQNVFNPDNKYLSIIFNSFLENIFLDLDEVIELTRIFESIIDFRSRFTATHSRGVSHTAVCLSKIIGMNDIDIKRMKIAGQLHDIGKLGIREYIIEKPGKLIPDEIIEMKNHALYTYLVLNEVRGFEEIPRWAALHHEKLNGKGYPFNKKENEICLGSRIMAVADIFTALMEDRPYRKGMNKDSALKVFEKLVKNRDLDGDIVATLRERYNELDYSRAIAQQEAAKEFQSFWENVYSTKN